MTPTDSNTPPIRAARTPGLVAGFMLPLPATGFLLAHRGIKRWAVMPLLANFIVYGLVIALAIYLLTVWEPTFDFNSDSAFAVWLGNVLTKSFDALKWVVFVPAVLVISYFTFTTVGMVIATPFNDVLSHRTEFRLTNPAAPSPTSIGYEFSTMLWSIRDAIGILIRQVFWTVLALPFLLVPVVGFVPLFLVTAWFGGVGFLDTAMSRNDLRNHHKKVVLRSRRWQILGLGVAMELLFMIPFVGLLVLPIGVIAGTMIYCQYDWNRLLRDAGLEAPKGFVAPVVPAK